MHDNSHVQRLIPSQLPAAERELGSALAQQLKHDKAILGIFDEGCMGMYNAIFDDEYINPLGIFKERLSQSALYYRMTTVTYAEAEAVYKWLVDRGVTFDFGSDPDNDLTQDQVLAMIIAGKHPEDVTQTDINGIAEFPILRPGGGYVVQVTMPGYAGVRKD